MRLLAVVAVALGLLSPVAVQPSAHAASGFRLMLYGDSITHGSTGDWTWRYRLWKHLQADRVAVDFVGPRNDVHPFPVDDSDAHGYADPDFDTDSASLWGQALTLPTYDFSETAGRYRPEVIVSLIGINDLLWLDARPEQVVAAMAQEISQARAVDPGVDVVLVQVPQTWYPGVADYDDDLVTLADELDTPEARVVTTALPAYVRDLDTWDDVHPSATGEVKLAAVVEDALAAIGIGGSAGVLPVVANGPAHPNVVIGAGQESGVALHWTAAPGADGLWVERRDATAEGEWGRYPYEFPAAAGTATFTDLVLGHRYQIRMRSTKGNALATVPSASVTVAAGGPILAAPTPAAWADAGGTVSISWPGVAGATAYAVEGRVLPDGVWTHLPGTMSSATWRGLRAGQRVEVRVRADHGVVLGDLSGPASVAVPTVGRPRLVSVRSPRRDRLAVAVRPVPFATEYRLEGARVSSCRRRPTRYRVLGTGAPTRTLRTPARAMWLRAVALRDGVAGPVSAAVCRRVR